MKLAELEQDSYPSFILLSVLETHIFPIPDGILLHVKSGRNKNFLPDEHHLSFSWGQSSSLPEVQYFLYVSIPAEGARISDFLYKFKRFLLTTFQAFK